MVKAREDIAREACAWSDADDDAVGAHKITDSGTFFEEFWVRRDVNFSLCSFDDSADPRVCADRHRAFEDEHAFFTCCGAHSLGHLNDPAKVRPPVHL